MSETLPSIDERSYQKGREDRFQEITANYILLTEEDVADIRNDVIMEFFTRLEKQFERTMLRRDEVLCVIYTAHTIAEQMMEGNECWMECVEYMKNEKKKDYMNRLTKDGNP